MGSCYRLFCFGLGWLAWMLPNGRDAGFDESEAASCLFGSEVAAERAGQLLQSNGLCGLWLVCEGEFNGVIEAMED